MSRDFPDRLGFLDSLCLSSSLLFASFPIASSPHAAPLADSQAMATFFATGAGIIYATPFGHGLVCSADPSSFPSAWAGFTSDCTRITTIEGFSWIMFALSIIGLVGVIVDKYEVKSVRSAVYEEGAEKSKPAGSARTSVEV